MQTQERTRVAIVEDDHDLVDALTFLLLDMGFETVACGPAYDVPSCIMEAQPGLVILDVRMGSIDGVEVFQQLRTNPSTSAIPVIFFTATEQRVASRLPNYREQGAYFVIKPNIALLSARIWQILGSPADV